MNKLSFQELIIGILFLTTSCGKGGSGVQRINQSPSNPISERCVTFSKNDTFEQIAIKSNKARVECNLSEEEILAMVEDLQN